MIEAIRALLVLPPGSSDVDPLSAWFLLVVLGTGAAAAAYGVPYLSAERPHRQVAYAHAQLAILIAALVGVVVARSVVSFLVAWEIMAVTAWLLVIFEHDHAEVRRAGFISSSRTPARSS
jgi:hydrogenase-4 component B